MEYLVIALVAVTVLILIIGLMIGDDKPNTSGKFDGWQ